MSRPPRPCPTCDRVMTAKNGALCSRCTRNIRARVHHNTRT